MEKKISLDNLSSEIKEILDTYNTSITQNTKKVVHEVSQNFKKNTRKDAPKGNRKKKKFYTHIDVKTTHESLSSATDTWYVKSPEYRLTHLIKDGHDIRNRKGGPVYGRTKGNDFIDKNLNIAEKELENKIIKVVE